jgi:hypothetical protein
MEELDPFYTTPEYLDIKRQMDQNRAAMDVLMQEYRGLTDPLVQQSNFVFSEQGRNQLLQQFAPVAQQQLSTMLSENPAYQSYINQANQIEGNISQLQATKQKALETGQSQRIQFSEPDGVTRWNLLIEPPGRESGYDQRQAFQNQGINPVPTNWVDQYQKDWTPTIQEYRQYATYTGLNDLADKMGRQDLFVSGLSRKPINEQANYFQQNLLSQIQNTLVDREANRVSKDAENRLAILEQQYLPRLESFDPIYNQLAEQSTILGRDYTAAQNALKFGQDPTQAIQQSREAQALREAEKTAYNQAYEQQAQQAIQNMYQTGTLPTFTGVQMPEVQQPTVTGNIPQYSFLSAQQTPVTAPAVTPAATQPAPVATQPAAQPTAALATQPVAQPAPQLTTNVGQPAIPSTNFLAQGIPAGISAQPIFTGVPMATTTSLNPQNLPELRSAGGGGTSAIDPTLRPYLELGLRAAEQQFLQTQPQFFPGQTYVSPSQQTLDALAAQEQIARAAPSSLQAAQESYMRGLGGLGATAGGAFLMGNPYQQMAIEAATRPIMQQYEEQTMPGIASGFSRAGRYGSGAMERAQGRAAEATGRAIGDVASNIAYSGYEAERGRQQQAITQQINAAQMAPQIYGQQFLPGQQLAQIGAMRETIAGLPLQEQMARFQFSQQAPRESLGAFLSSVYGTPMARSQYAPTPETQTNRAANVFGLGALGAGVGSMIAGDTGAFGFSRPQTITGGAVLGALGGLLS